MRSMFTGSVGFGMVNIPVKLYKVTDSSSTIGLCNVHNKSIPFHKTDDGRCEGDSEVGFRCRICDTLVPSSEIEYRICGTAVSAPKYCSVCDEALEASDMQKAFPEDKKKEYCIPISEEEIASLPLKSLHVIQIDGCIAQIPDIRYYDEFYVLEPGDGGARAYALLETALRETGVIAIAKVTTGTKEHLCGIMPTGDGLLYVVTFHWAEDLRSMEEVKRPGVTVSEKELAMAKMLIDMLPKDVDLGTYKNEYGEALKNLVEAKKAGDLYTPLVAPVASKEEDLYEALMASCKAASPVEA